MSRTRLSPENNGVTRMDIMPLEDSSDWFRIDDDYQTTIAQKKALLKQHRPFITATLPEGEAGAKELLEIMADYLPKHFPEKFKKEGRLLKNLATGDRYDLDHLPDDPMTVAGLLVQEDLVLLHEGQDGKIRLSAGSLHFPSDWSLKDKLGKTVTEIHARFPEMNQHISNAINSFLKNLKPDRPYWRINYLTTPSGLPAHFPDLPGMSHYYDDKETTPQNADRFYLRNEREVFNRLPQSKDVVFSIRPYLTPFCQLPPVIAGLLADIIRNLPKPFVNQTRRWTDSEKQHILDFLDQKTK